jgi:cation-transporting ATPase 13A1
MAPLVDDSQIKSAELLSPLPTYLHLYVWPFAVAWPVFARYYLSPDLYAKHIASEEWTFVWCGSIITLQSLAWLCTHWSVDLKGAFTATRAKNIEEAQLIKVIPIANAGSAEICKLERETVRLSRIPPPGTISDIICCSNSWLDRGQRLFRVSVG